MKYICVLFIILSTQFLFSQDARFAVCPLKVGEAIPNTMLTSDAGDTIQLSNLIDEKPTVVIFYRGAWCGYCTKHLSELNEIKPDVETMGYQILGITVDKPEKLSESIDRSSTEIDVYSDAMAETIMAFGLDWKVDNTLFEKYKNEYKLDLEDWSGQDHHSLPVPAIFVIKDNKVAFQYVNPDHAVRLKPETLLAVLKTL